MCRIIYLSVVGLLLSSLTPPSARAADPASLDKRARKACLTGDFRKGAEILSQMYIDTGEATYLFNLGRCYEQNHRWQEALDAFREYRRKAGNLSPAEAADTEKHIADCELFLAKEEAKRSPPTPPVVAPGVAASSASALPASEASGPVAGVATEAAPAAAGGGGAGLRTVGIVLGAAGAASLVAGLLLNLQANRLADEVNDDYSRSKASTRSTYETLSWIGYGVGAAALVAGGISYGVGVKRRGASAASAPTVSPVVGPQRAGLILQGAF